MKRWLIVGSIFLPALLWGQSRDQLKQEIKSYAVGVELPNCSFKKVDAVVDRLEKRRLKSRDDASFLKFLFESVHNNFLKSYQNHTTFDQLLTRGEYNCLTATALYASLLNYFEYDFSIVETNFHIFLTINLLGDTFLLETTDPNHGFISSHQQVARQLKIYQSNLGAPKNLDEFHEFNSMLFDEVEIKQLPGLMYYNLAVDAFNQQKISESVELLNYATRYYDSSRIHEFSCIILDALEGCSLQQTEKQECVATISSILRH